MALGKLLKLGGIDNSVPRTQQSVGRFRVARNVRPTNDGFIIPRTAQENISATVPEIEYIHYITRYVDGSFLIVASILEDDNYYLQMYKASKGWTTIERLPSLLP